MGINKVNYGNTTLIDISNDTVTAGSMLDGVTAHDNSGAAITGTIASKSSSDLTASGATVTVPAGYYSSQASKSVASGTAGTPTATKGTVSNHAISVTPSVTNTAGYISGGTKTGTAVSVSASELVSGNKAITANGTGIDVANYSTVSVAVETGVHVDVITASSNHWGYADSGRTIYFYGLKGEPTSFAMITSGSFSRNTSQRNYYILNILYDGTSTVGRYFYVYNGSTTHDTSHYSFSYSSSYGGKSNVLVITSSSTSYGTFYRASDAYELVYTY